MLEDVVDDAAEEGDVAAGPDRHVAVASALVRVKRGSTWMTFAPRSLGLHDPLEADRMALGHVRPHDHDAVGVLEVLLEVGRAAAPERGPQTGDRRAVSYARLVLDLDRAQRREELLDEVVLLVVERRAAEAARCPACGAAAARRRRGPPTSGRASRSRGRRSCPSPGRAELLPLRPYGRRYFTLYSRSGLVTKPLRRRRPSGTAGRGRSGRRDRPRSARPAVLDVDALPAADRAVRADRLHHALGTIRSRP